MKKFVKVVLILILVIIIIVVVTLKVLSNRPAAPSNYQQTTQTGGEIEAKYLANGPYEVSVKEEETLLDFGKFWIYYPSKLTETDKKYPVIVICNGSGTPLSKYPTVAEHYASWGFIVIGTEEMNSWNAFGAEMSIRYLERMIKTAHIIEDSSGEDEVGLFNTVTVYVPEDDEEEQYKIVTTVRGNSLEGLISIDSPVGKALLGHKVGDAVSVQVSETYSYDMVIKKIEKTVDDGSDGIRRF